MNGNDSQTNATIPKDAAAGTKMNNAAFDLVKEQIKLL